jgi:putative PEP-CTERM system histidine kinase
MTGTLYALCAAAYLALAAFVLLRTRLNPSRLPLMAACLLNVLWAGTSTVATTAPLGGALGLVDLVRLAAWYGVTLVFYRRFVPGQVGPGRAFAVMGLLIALMVGGAMLVGLGRIDGTFSLLSVGLAARLVLAICELLLLENLLRNAPEEARWNVNLACIGLGALAVYDILLCTDAALFRQVSPVLADGRALANVLVAPLLALAAVRTQKAPALAISRTAAFHSASLVASGVLLLVLAGVGEVFRAFGTRWGAVAEVGLICAGVIGVAVLLTSGAGRSHIRAALVDPFFAERYDYRREWLRCIDTLAGAGSGAPLHARVIRTIAQVVDSPAGVLFLREAGHGTGEASFQWAGSWNLPAVAFPVPSDHPLLRGFGTGEEITVPDFATLMQPPIDALPELWLAVPLPQAGGQPAGFVLVTQPRAPFALDAEVFALLRTVAREVATYLAEQRALEALMEARQLRDFGKRFAFVAHDIKNVSSQLSLLLANAELHMDNPEFQRDMLETVRASVRKIGALLRRLQEPPEGIGGGMGGSAAGRVEPLGRVKTIAATCRRLRGANVVVEADAPWAEQAGGEMTGDEVAIGPAAFDAVVTHLLDNAVEAAGPAAATRIVLRHDGLRVLVDIVDHGPGMTPDFVREELFRPFRTSKSEGSGIGAFQARELLREAGGDLIVLSRPGEGTTMRLLLPLAEAAAILPGG